MTKGNAAAQSAVRHRRRESDAAQLRSESGCRNGSAVRLTARTPAKASGVEENKRRRRTHNRRGGRSKAPTAPHRGEVEDAAGERPKKYQGSRSTKKRSSAQGSCMKTKTPESGTRPLPIGGIRFTPLWQFISRHRTVCTYMHSVLIRERFCEF